MTTTILFIVSFLVFLGLIIFLVLQVSRKKNNLAEETREMDYRTFFALGIIFLPTGIAMAITTGEFFYNGLTSLGIIYLIIGLANRSKWKSK